MSTIDDFIKRDALAKHLGIRITEVSAGMARAEMEIREIHLNSAGTVHGGAIFSLADAAFAAASNAHGTLAVAVNAGISYFRALKSGTLFATAEEVSFNPKLATYVIEVTNEAGDRIALFQGMVYRKRESISELLNNNERG